MRIRYFEPPLEAVDVDYGSFTLNALLVGELQWALGTYGLTACGCRYRLMLQCPCHN